MKAGEAGEKRVIAALTKYATSPLNGDDAAVLPMMNPNARVVLSTDAVVEGRHFRLDWQTPAQVGQRAIMQAVADIEAMGARPSACLLTAAVPADTELEVLTELSRGLATGLQQAGASLIGGDVVAAPGGLLQLDITAVGELGGSIPPLKLSSARAGCAVIAAGKIGYAAAGLAVLSKYGREYREQITASQTQLAEPQLARLLAAADAAVNQFCVPEVALGRGQIARAAGACAMTDNSDGLIHDLEVMAAASGVRIDLSSTAIAPEPALVRLGALLDQDPWEWVLSGGEDHTLLGVTRNDVPSGFRLIGRTSKHKAGPAVCVDSVRPQYSSGWESMERN